MLPGSTTSLPVVADHELVRPIGHGAYGEVWLARHTRLGTLRAVKIVRRDQFDDARPFQREFDGIRRYEPISRGHPNLVAILHVGGTDECFFYVMELADRAQESGIRSQESEMLDPSRSEIDSRPLSPDTYSPHTLRAELKQHGALSIDRCLEIGLALVGALAHLHTRGLVHRDVKPSNVIFVGGVAKLADIGLVAAVSDSRSFVGTEGYIPPEGPGTPSADCYALGKLLYELSTGHDRTAWPEPPADLPTRPDRERLLELNAILHRACAPQPPERYRDAEAMLADLERLAAGKSIRRVRRIERHWHSVRRVALWLLVGTGLLVVFLLAARLGQPPANVEAHKRSTNVLANDLYDVGRSLYLKNTPLDIAKAAEKFQAAAEADPNFALALAALAAAWSWGSASASHENFPFLARAREVADRALAMDNFLSEAHLALAWHAYIKEWDWPKAEAEFQKAINCDPSNPQPHEWQGLFLLSLGRTQEALREFERAVDMNPHSMTANRFLVNGLIAARRYKEGLAKARKTAELGDGFSGVPNDALLWCGEVDESITVNEQLAIASGKPAAEAQSQATELRRALKEEGVAAFWNKRLEFMRQNEVGIVVLAGACAAAGRLEESLDLLERAYREHHDWLVWDVATHPTWDYIRGQPRFQELLRKLRLEQGRVGNF